MIQAVRRLLSRMLGGTSGQPRMSLDGETRKLLAEFAKQSQMTPDEAAVCLLALQARAYHQDQDIAQVWATLTPREQQVVALGCLGHSGHEIAAMVGIAYGTARTHLYKAIDKLGINKKAQLQFLLRNWDFSRLDRDF